MVTSTLGTYSSITIQLAIKKLKTRAAVGPLTKSNRELTNNPKEMANILQEQYESVYSTPRPDKQIINPIIFFMDAQNADQQLAEIQICEQDIVEAIKEMTPEVATGPDGFHPQLLKNCNQELAKPIRHLWVTSLSAGEIPTILKGGIITLIHKGGRGLASQHRPITLTSHLIKICEKVMRNKLRVYLDNKRILSNWQHGFRLG